MCSCDSRAHRCVTSSGCVSTPAEQVLSQISGVEHVWSVSKPGLAVLSVQFKVGLARTEALVRLYDTVNANADWLAVALGVGAAPDEPEPWRRACGA